MGAEICMALSVSSNPFFLSLPSLISSPPSCVTSLGVPCHCIWFLDRTCVWQGNAGYITLFKTGLEKGIFSFTFLCLAYIKSPNLEKAISHVANPRQHLYPRSWAKRHEATRIRNMSRKRKGCEKNILSNIQYSIDLAPSFKGKLRCPSEIHTSSTGPLAYLDHRKIIQKGNGQ